MKATTLFLVAAAQISAAIGAEAPLQGTLNPPDIARFAPMGWVSTQSVQGDLNGDGKAIENAARCGCSGMRPLPRIAPRASPRAWFVTM